MSIFDNLPPTCQIKNLVEIYDRFFPGKTDGIFVEIGAYDGYTWSNTWGLAELGWEGFYFEAVELLADMCRERHKNNKVLTFKICIGSYDGEIDLYLHPGQPTSCSATTDLNSVEHKLFCDYSKDCKIQVPIRTMDSLLPDLLVGFEFDLLCIDVEGAEVDILKGMDLKVWKPTLIIIETHEDHWVKEYHTHLAEVQKIIAESGYVKVQSDLINTIYVRN